MQKYHLTINDDTSNIFEVGKLAETILVNASGEKIRNLSLSLFDENTAEKKEQDLLNLSDYCIPNSIEKIEVKNDSGVVVYRTTCFTQFNSCTITLHDIGEREEIDGAEYVVSASADIQ